MVIDSKSNKQKILQDFIKLSEDEGVSDEILAKSAKNTLKKEALIDLVFEDGCLDLIDFYIDEKNNEASQKLKKIKDFSNFKIRDKIRTILYLRFEVEKDNRLFLQNIFSFYINPKNLCLSSKGLKPATKIVKDCYKVADFIWHEINDKSTDLNFYTKRLTLSKIIIRVLKEFIKDQSDDLANTKKLIDSEIDKVMLFEKYKRGFKDFVKNNFLNEECNIKTPKDFINNLPFFRLRKK